MFDHFSTMRVPLNTLTQKKKSILHQSATDPPMYITIEDHDFDKEINATVYSIEIGFQHNSEVEIIKCKKRYSELLQLDSEINSLFDNSLINPSFPPKRWFGSLDKNFVNQRAEKLQRYFTDICKINTVISSKHFQTFFGITENLLSGESSSA